ncbi:MAG: helix-turn-helix transcriptional regulator [Pseudomonadota bacterium]
MAKTIRSTGQEALRQALVDARTKAGLSQKELAAKLRHHQSFVARVESGERRIDVVELVVLARAIGFDASEILAIVEAATEPNHRI